MRGAEPSEIDPVAQVWYDAWRDAHAEILPAALVRLRTLGSFRERIRANLPAVRVIGPVGAPIGLYMLKGAELDQLFVSAPVRGTGIAARLIDDAEARLAAAGVDRAWLACAIGNDRAARFYEKRGWRRVGTMVHHAETSEGKFLLDVWRYEKDLSSR